LTATPERNMPGTSRQAADDNIWNIEGFPEALRFIRQYAVNCPEAL